MQEIVVGEGNRCWLVSLGDREEPFSWRILKSFPTEQEAIRWAADLLRDLSIQRERMASLGS